MRARIVGAAAAAVTAVVLGAPGAQPAPDYDRAKQLYDQATDEMTAGKYAEAADDFGAAYDITHDPILFFKIGGANEKAGRCSVAVIYYGRYLKEAKPDPKYIELAKERIAACGGEAGSGAAGSAADTGSAGSAAAGSAGSAAPGSGAGSGSAEPPPAAPEAGSGTSTGTIASRHGSNAAWLLVGGAIAFLTTGAVLAYSANSSEQDLRDLYVGLAGVAPTYDMATATRYQQLLDEGHRYEYLSWTAFGLAAACGGVATYLFLRGDHRDERVTVAPLAAPHAGGVSAAIRW